MNQKRVRWCVNWCAIIVILTVSICTTTNDYLWSRFTYIAPVPIFCVLCILFAAHASLRDCIYSKDKDFFLMCAGIVLSVINMVLAESRVGAFFTITNFLLILYLADKIRFDKIQLATMACVSFFIIFYWIFVNKGVYGNVNTNSNRAAIFIFIHFCVFMCCMTYLMIPYLKNFQWHYHVIALLIAAIVAKRILSLRCRGVFLAIIVWMATYYLAPKKKYTSSIIIGTSLLMPALYVLFWKSGMMDGVVIFGKRLASGRDAIWYEFFKAFIQHPITGIGSDFDRVLPDLYLKDTHHALLDLLFVHGIPVFMIVLYLMRKQIGNVIDSSSGLVRAVCLASIYGMITSGTLENAYIVSPCNVLFMMFFVVSQTSSQERPKA